MVRTVYNYKNGQDYRGVTCFIVIIIAAVFLACFYWKLSSLSALFPTSLCGVLFLFCIPSASRPPSAPRPSFTRTTLSHTTLSHTPLFHPQVYHTQLLHTLAQKHLCEFWCGMHRTCKNTAIKPDRSGWMTRSEKLCEVNCSDAAQSSSIDIGKRKQVVWKRQGGSRVSHVPLLKVDIETVENWMQVRPGDQPGYPKDTIESFVGHSSMGLLCPPAWNNVK